MARHSRQPLLKSILLINEGGNTSKPLKASKLIVMKLPEPVHTTKPARLLFAIPAF